MANPEPTAEIPLEPAPLPPVTDFAPFGRQIPLPAGCTDLLQAPPDLDSLKKFWYGPIMEVVITTVLTNPHRTDEDPFLTIKRFERYLLAPCTPGRKKTKTRPPVPPARPTGCAIITV